MYNTGRVLAFFFCVILQEFLFRYARKAVPFVALAKKGPIVPVLLRRISAPPKAGK